VPGVVLEPGTSHLWVDPQDLTCSGSRIAPGLPLHTASAFVEGSTSPGAASAAVDETATSAACTPAWTAATRSHEPASITP
jgi:hypothetical protein